VARYLRNFEHVEKKMIELEEKDQIRNFQPPITGEEIMRLFTISPGPIIGEIKEEIKEAILEGIIKNDHQEAVELLMKIALRKGLINSEINT
jgi:poly(A) polymerase